MTERDRALMINQTRPELRTRLCRKGAGNFSKMINKHQNKCSQQIPHRCASHVKCKLQKTKTNQLNRLPLENMVTSDPKRYYHVFNKEVYHQLQKRKLYPLHRSRWHTFHTNDVITIIMACINN